MSLLQWKSKLAVLQDLTELTHGMVPVDIDHSITVNVPPTYYINEVEDDFFNSCSSMSLTDVNFSQAPDLHDIKNMLNLIRDDSEPHESSKIAVNESIQINKLALLNEKPNSKIKRNSKTVPKEIVKETTKPKRHRNAAIASILAKKEISVTLIDDNSSVLQLKQADFMGKSKTIEANQNSTDEKIELRKNQESIDKVTNRMKNTIQVINNGPPIFTSSMFKRKSSKPMSNTKSPDNVSTTSSETISPQRYVPSASAAMYYKKFLAQSEMKLDIVEDIWIRAERQMKEIEVNKKLEAEAEMAKVQEAEHLRILEKCGNLECTVTGEKDDKIIELEISSLELNAQKQGSDEDPNPEELNKDQNNIALPVEKLAYPDMDFQTFGSRRKETTEPDNAGTMDIVSRYPQILRLPQHRHLLTGDCIVCAVLCDAKKSEEL